MKFSDCLFSFFGLVLQLFKLKPSFIYANSLGFFADLRPFKPPALVGLMCFSECVIRNKLVTIIIVITVMKNGFIYV